MPFGIGVTELVILLVALLIIFGPKRLPEMGRSLGKGMREFKDSISGNDKDDEPSQMTTQLPVGTQDTTAPAPPREQQRETEHIS